MSTEFSMWADYQSRVEHDITLTLPGEVESVRARLSEALEEMGYRVLGEAPLLAKRSARCRGASGCSNDILDYAITLTVGLKAVGTQTTRVTFDYEVKNYWLGTDKVTLRREAEAIAALANARIGQTHCAACGAEMTGTKFCRRCGAPHAATEPAELEVLRLTAGGRAAYKGIGLGISILAAALLSPLLLLTTDDPVRLAKIIKGVIALSTMFGASGLFMLLGGLWRMYKTFSLPAKKGKEEEEAVRTTRRNLTLPQAALPAAQVPVASVSVTEGTTDLLPQERQAAER